MSTLTPACRRLAVPSLPAVLLAVLYRASLPGSGQAYAETDAELLVISLVNQERSAPGLVPLRQINDLVAILRSRASAMASTNALSHSVGGDIGAQLADAASPGTGTASAIAYTTTASADSAARTPIQYVDGQPAHWMPMSPAYNYVGVGRAHRRRDLRFGIVFA